jgi:hypothetical protein
MEEFAKKLIATVITALLIIFTIVFLIKQIE